MDAVPIIGASADDVGQITGRPAIGYIRTIIIAGLKVASVVLIALVAIPALVASVLIASMAVGATGIARLVRLSYR